MSYYTYLIIGGLVVSAVGLVAAIKTQKAR